MYLSCALETYRELDPIGQKQLLGEVAAVGQQGWPSTTPTQNATSSITAPTMHKLHSWGLDG